MLANKPKNPMKAIQIEKSYFWLISDIDSVHFLCVLTALLPFDSVHTTCCIGRFVINFDLDRWHRKTIQTGKNKAKIEKPARRARSHSLALQRQWNHWWYVTWACAITLKTHAKTLAESIALSLNAVATCSRLWLQHSSLPTLIAKKKSISCKFKQNINFESIGLHVTWIISR